MARRFGRWALVLIVAAGSAAGAAERHDGPANPINPTNAKLLASKPAERAAVLAQAVGHWCIGTEAFPMGVTKSGKAAGFAYWSLRCADGSAWAVQIDPLANVTSMNCATFDALGNGKQCFKRF
jgi:hypothetical protein